MILKEVARSFELNNSSLVAEIFWRIVILGLLCVVAASLGEGVGLLLGSLISLGLGVGNIFAAVILFKGSGFLEITLLYYLMLLFLFGFFSLRIAQKIENARESIRG